MSRTDSGFEEYPRQPKPKPTPREEVGRGRGSSFSETAEEPVDDDFSTTNLTATRAQADTSSSSAPDRQAAPLNGHGSRSTIANTTAPSSTPQTPERPALKKRRSRPSSKHSARSSGRSSGAYPRPSLSTRVRSFPAELPLHRGDIDSVLALHSRSCNLFQSFSVPSSAPQSPGLSSTGRPSADFPRQPLSLDTGSLASLPRDPAPFYSMPSPAASTYSSHRADADADADADPHVSTPVVPPPTVIHWNSPSTRRREYAEIDRSTRGIRGFLRRITPRWLARRPRRQAFYDGGKDDDDACSVRRYRIPLEEEEDAAARSTTCPEKGEKERPMSAPTRIAKMMRCY